MRLSLFFLIAIIFLGVSCTKEHDIIDIDEEPLTPVTNVEVNSLIISIGEDIPFSCVINNQEYFSESSGILFIKNILLEQKGNSILIKSEGYFDEVRYVVPSLGGHLYIEVRLLETSSAFPGGMVRQFNGFDAKEGGVISVSRLNLNIAPNSFVDAQGNDYEGNANISLYTLYDAAYATTIRSFPQVHFIEERKDRIFNPYEGINMVINDEMMNPLFLKEGSSIDLEFELFNPVFTIPDILEVRYYDKETDDWIDNGKTEKVDEKWKISITDIGIIALGISYESRPAEIKLVIDEGVPVTNKLVWIYTSYETPVNLAFSDGEGKVRIHVPLDIEFSLLTLEVAAIPPNVSKEYSSIGSGAEVLLELDDFSVNSENFQVYNGNVVGCHGNVIEESAIITKGPLKFIHNEYISYMFPNEYGMYNFAYPKHSSNEIIKFRAFNVASNSESLEFVISNDNEQSVDFGSLLICEEFESYINYNIDGEQYEFSFDGEYSTTFTNPLYLSVFTANASSGAGENNRTTFSIEHNSSLSLNADYELEKLAININNGQDVYSFECNSDCNHSILVSRIAANYYEGLIKYTDNQNSEVIIGSFRLPRQ